MFMLRRQKQSHSTERLSTAARRRQDLSAFLERLPAKALLGGVAALVIVSGIGVYAFHHQSSPGQTKRVTSSGSAKSASSPTATKPASSPSPVKPVGPPPCQFQKADQPLQVAFCDSFAQPMPTAGNRSGDLNAVVWGVSRIIAGGGDHYPSGTNPSQGSMDDFAPVALQRCGTTQTVYPTGDVVICDSQVVEGVNDDGGQTVLAMYPKQPFEIAGRTGTVTFDVSADSEGPHAAWPTFVYTDQPVPAPYSKASGIQTSARNSFGFTLASPDYITRNASDRCGGNGTSVDSMFVTRNYILSALAFRELDCVARPSSPTQLNHFEVRISQSEVQVWGTDPGSKTLREIADADNANLPLTRGLVWLEDVHYNADKFNDQQSHTFDWSNLGFDGPVLPRDLAFDAPNNGSMDNDSRWPGHPAEQLGWAPDANMSVTVHVPGVSNVSQAAAALLVFNFAPDSETVPSMSVNGNPSITTAWPFNGDTYMWRTIGVLVPLSEIKTGTNTVTFKMSDGNITVANVDLVMVGAGGKPTCFDPSNCSATPISG
jgi:hypothetical protein